MTQLTELNEKIKYLTEQIEKNPENAKLYLDRANYYEKVENYENAIQDFSKAIAFAPNVDLLYFLRGSCYRNIKEYDKAIEDLNKAIALKPKIRAELCYFCRGSCYESIGEYDKAIDDYTKAIEYKQDYIEIYYLRAVLYQKINKFQEALHDYNKIIEMNPENTDMYKFRGFLYLTKLKNYDKALEDFEKAQLDASQYKKLVRHIFEYYNERDKVIAKLEERNKILSALSHSIKNTIATAVIDPLNNLKKETVVKLQLIENALRGANLIHDIVKAINSSVNGTIDDFYYDSKHNNDKDSMNLKTIIMESLQQSAGNMFDSKYFGNFMRKYFPKKEQYVAAKAEWADISQSKNLKSLEQFLKSYFFETDFVFENAQSYAIGNEKGSAVKLLILFQEVILNAVKYSAFVSKEKRFLRIHFTSNADTISVKVENPFDERTKTKTTGIGHVVIQNFAKLLNTESVISKENSVYCVVIQFENLWKGSAQ